MHLGQTSVCSEFPLGCSARGVGLREEVVQGRDSWKRVRLSSSDVRGVEEAGGVCFSPFLGRGLRRQMELHEVE